MILQFNEFFFVFEENHPKFTKGRFHENEGCHCMHDSVIPNSDVWSLKIHEAYLKLKFSRKRPVCRNKRPLITFAVTRL